MTNLQRFRIVRLGLLLIGMTIILTILWQARP